MNSSRSGSAGEYRSVSSEELTGDERVVGLDEVKLNCLMRNCASVSDSHSFRFSARSAMGGASTSCTSFVV